MKCVTKSRLNYLCVVRASFLGVVVLVLCCMVGGCRAAGGWERQLVEQVSVQLVGLGQRDLQQEPLRHQLLQLST